MLHAMKHALPNTTVLHLVKWSAKHQSHAERGEQLIRVLQQSPQNPLQQTLGVSANAARLLHHPNMSCAAPRVQQQFIKDKLPTVCISPQALKD